MHIPTVNNDDCDFAFAHCTIFSSARDIMAATQKLYPRGTVKRVVKAHSNRSVSKNADILVRLRPVPDAQMHC